jgi:hypothetical protein
MAFDPAIIPAIIGMGAKIGGAIPGLKKPKRTNAGGRAAARTASQAGAAGVAGASTGHGASRGLALREGIRGASKLVGAAAGASADAAQKDELLYQEQLLARNERIGDLTAGIGEGMGQMAQAFIKPKAGSDDANRTIQAQPEMTQDSATGLSTDGHALGAGVGEAPSQQALDTTAEHMTDPDGATLVELEQQFADEASGPTADFKSTKALEELITLAPSTAAPALEADLELRLQAKKLMLQDAERLGYNFGDITALINRQFNLKPGQSTENPLGVSLDYAGGE